MKKIISLLLSLILLVSMTSVVFADNESETLSAIGILPAFSGGATSNVTRAEFAFMTARLVGAKYAPTVTRFADVGESNMYSGYVEHLASIGVVSGHGDGNFDPEGSVTYAQAAKMITNVLGYDEYGIQYGGYPNGYIELLSRLGLNKGVVLAWDKVLTVDEAVKLIHNALTMELNSVSYVQNGGELNSWISSDKKDSLLSSKFGISVYEGVVNSVNDSGTFVNITISGNKYDSNPVVLSKGQNVDFELGSGISGDSYVNVPSVIWVDENESIVKIAPQRGIEIKYVQIAKINDTDSNFPIGNINTIMFLDDETEYDVADDAILFYNGYKTTSSAYLNGKFAKVITKNDEVIFIESWDLVDGGLITNSDGDTITYIKDGRTTYLRDLANEKKVLTIIGENGAKITEVKAGSTFMYYRRDGYCVVVASEKKVVDKFTSVSANSVQIGQVSYKTKTTRYTESGPQKAENLVYYSEDGENFSNTEYVKLLDRNVEAYIGPDGFVWLIKALTQDSGIRKFYGLVKGTKVDNMDPEFGEIEVIEIDDSFTETVYKITDKTVFNDGLNLVEMATDAKAKSLSGEGIYVFEVSASGKIVSISEPDPIYGYEDTVTTVSSFGTVAVAKLAPHYIYWNGGQKILVIYEKNSKLTLGWTSWTALYDLTAKLSLNLHLFGEGMESVPSLIVLTGGATPISEFGSQERYGIITNIMDTLGDDGEVMKEISMIMKAGNKKYTVRPEWLNYVDANGTKHVIGKNTIIKFKEDVKFGDNDIVILDDYIKPLSSDISEWESASGWKMGIAEGADANRVLVRDFGGMEEGSLFFHITMNFIAVYDSSAPVTQFTLGSWSDIDAGDTILYNNIGDGTRGVIIIK